MKKLLSKIAVATVLFAISSFSAHAGYVYVGTWNVNSGPNWNPMIQPILTGQDAAALLFGGNAADYAISTNSDDVNTINFSTWVSAFFQGQSGAIVAQDYFSDANGNGIYDHGGDTSAYIQDWCENGNCVNYAFRITNGTVPEPTSIALLSLGLLGFAATRRRKK